MRELFLHVGMHKTGTTSIQKTLHAHAPLLRQYGYDWFDAGDPNHSRVVFSAFTEAPHLYALNRRNGLQRPEAAAHYAESCRSQLLAFLSGATGPRLILSGESIGTLRRDAIARLLAAFRPLVDRITVIGFVRPPRAYVVSAMQQRILNGETLAGLRQRPATPRYRGRFAPFIGAPEVAVTLLHPFTPETLLHGCSVATFLKLIGAPDDLYPQLTVVRANAGGSHLSRVLALAANQAVPIFGADGGPNPERATRLDRFLDSLPGPRFEAPAALVAASLAESVEDIAWMERQLGAPFAATEKTVPDDGGGDDVRALTTAELGSLVTAINALLGDAQGARAARRPDLPLRRNPMTDPPPSDEVLARRAERRRLRQHQP